MLPTSKCLLANIQKHHRKTQKERKNPLTEPAHTYNLCSTAAKNKPVGASSLPNTDTDPQPPMKAKTQPVNFVIQPAPVAPPEPAIPLRPPPPAAAPAQPADLDQLIAQVVNPLFNLDLGETDTDYNSIPDTNTDTLEDPNAPEPHHIAKNLPNDLQPEDQNQPPPEDYNPGPAPPDGNQPNQPRPAQSAQSTKFGRSR